jgi:hypothetical protein
MIVARKNLGKMMIIPAIIPGAERVDSMRILGVTISSNLKMNQHLKSVIASASSSLYALGILRSHGLSGKSLHEVAKATTIAQALYASPAWWGYTSNEERKKINNLVNRMKRRGFLPEDSPGASTMAEEADDTLFKAIQQNPNHVLRKLFPTTRRNCYSLRPRTHNFNLPLKDNRNFISRILYKNTY